LLCGGAGCNVGEAIVDGAYGGVSDTVAAIVSGTLLGVIRQNDGTDEPG